MFKFIVVALAICIALFFLVRIIIKLPSRYERHPKNISPWNALDEGIDPSVSDELKQ